MATYVTYAIGSNTNKFCKYMVVNQCYTCQQFIHIHNNECLVCDNSVLSKLVFIAPSL